MSDTKETTTQAKAQKKYLSKKEYRRARAEEMHEAWRSMSPQQQLADLDRRLGKGIGAVKQRARISLKLQQLEQKQNKKT